MKAKLLNNEEMVNPVYLETPANERRGVAQVIPIPAGEVIDSPDAWMLCVVGKAVPADDECKARYDKYLGDPRRKQLLEQVKRLRAANGVKALDKKTLKWLEYMEATYATELGLKESPAAASK